MKPICCIKYGLVCLSLLIGLGACDKFNDPSVEFTEVPKNITGTWKIIQVTRNGTDVTGLMDFSRFRIHFKEDNTYAIDNYLPFLVKKDGSWHLDDPLYPFNIVFKEDAADESLVYGFYYPVVDGHRQISLSFKPGCANNIYTYIFAKES
ncbi:MAG: DUF5004 domain-containing protein [Dysgonamonadaceae bacterium]|jgi:hypothetical protein|nr:DUF5004 domain-containing protein [Dysgonamonadaceae bacterium]